MTPSTRILSLAAAISEATTIVNTYFTTHNLPTPSFDISGPARIIIPPGEKQVTKAYTDVLSATMELHHLMLGPTAVLMGISSVDSLSLSGIYTYRMAHTFPIDSETSFEQISEKCGLNLIDTKRILRHAMTNHIFKEEKSGIVTHTAASKLLAENRLMEDFVGISCEEKFRAQAHTVQALKKWGYAKEPSQSGFSLGYQTTNGLYDELRLHPARGRRFANAMSAYAEKIPLEPLIEGYDWGSLCDVRIADVGGGYGPVSIGLAEIFPDLQFIVQDLHDVIVDGPAHVPVELSDRISFMSYNILTPQPLHSVEILFFRAVLHNWTDEYCVRILKNQIPALKKDSRVVIVEPKSPEPGESEWMEERRLRAIDLNMLSYFGSRERGTKDWETIFRKTDERFEMGKVCDLKGIGSSLMEFIWRGELDGCVVSISDPAPATNHP